MIMPDNLLSYMNSTALADPLKGSEAEPIADEIAGISDMQVYPKSITAINNMLLFLGRRDKEKYIGIISRKKDSTPGIDGHDKNIIIQGEQCVLTAAPAAGENAAALREILTFLSPRPIGLYKSAGCGDRLGLATPGHIRAFRDSGMAPVLAQQSMRENDRTRRSPQDVVDDAMWGVFQEGWRKGYGADADHLKTTDEIDACVEAGYTMYTIDPGEYVDDRTNIFGITGLEELVDALPWDILDSNPRDLEHRLAGVPVDLGNYSLTVSRDELLRSAVKYGRAVAHTVCMYYHLLKIMNGRPFELEVSVDETDSVTTPAEHIYIANELKRLDVKWVSLAPRYAGTFEKGVDYIGSLDEFGETFAFHVSIAKTFGPYKLSLHSGSDKFSIYPITSKLAGDLIHIKTSGTSYLEALRAIAALNPDLFRDIVAFAINHYSSDRIGYIVSGLSEEMPSISELSDDQLPTLLDDFHGREVLHVTYGSVLNHEPFHNPFFNTLRENEDEYYRVLAIHFNRHFECF